MKKFVKNLLAIVLFASTAYGMQNSGNTLSGCCQPCCGPDLCCYDCNNCCLGPCDGYPFLLYRSQGRNAARELVGWQQVINQYCHEDRYGALTLAVEYTRSIRPERIAQFLFGSDLANCCELLIQGQYPCNNSDIRNPRAWDASHFGLPSDYSSKVSFCPRIQNVIVDLNYYAGFDNLLEGLYAKINIPIAWTKWQLCMRETMICSGNNSTPAGFLSDAIISRTNLPATFTQVISGGTTYGDMQSPMKYGLMKGSRCTKTRIAQVDLSLGYNWYLEKNYHAGGFLYLAIPTGNRPCARYLFEPMVGNGHHWELGFGFSGSYIFWQDCKCDNRYMGIWLETTVSHLFRDWQCRSFDFCNKSNSRYMLLAQMGTNDDMIRVGNNPEPEIGVTCPPYPEAAFASYQYKQNLIPAINWSTFNVGVRIPIQADIAIKLGWIRDNWSVDVGYNFWARTGEKFTLDNCDRNAGTHYALKGNAYMYGTACTPIPIAPGSCTCDTVETSMAGTTKALEEIVLINHHPIPIPFSSSLSRIAAHTVGDPKNTNIDNKQPAWASNGYQLLTLSDSEQIYASEPPLLVSHANLNVGKSPSSITHKLFLHGSYAWNESECSKYEPFIGLGGEIEFAIDDYKECCKCCDCCDNYNRWNSDRCSNWCSCTTPIASSVSTGGTNCYNTCCSGDCCCQKRGGISQWGVWLKCGVAFE